jgi:sulfur-carrier protein
MIRVVLPHFICATLARVDGEVQLEVPKAGHDSCGARRARGALSRVARHDPRPRHAEAAAVRPFFACKEDLSLEPPETPLPDAVASGEEPFLIVGAMAGG